MGAGPARPRRRPHTRMREEILTVLSGTPDRWTAGAVSWSLGRPVLGVLGQDADPDVAEALTRLAAEGLVAELPACPECGTPGTLYVLAERLSGEHTGLPPMSGVEIDETMEPLIAEGLIELSEIVEFDQRDCCARTSRAWRRAPRPS